MVFVSHTLTFRLRSTSFKGLIGGQMSLQDVPVLANEKSRFQGQKRRQVVISELRKKGE